MLLQNSTDYFSSKCWSLLLRLILEKYLKETTICVLWSLSTGSHLNTKNLTDFSPIISINLDKIDLDNNYFANDEENSNYLRENLRKSLQERGIFYRDPLTLELTLFIQHSYCESFLVFDENIERFVEAFQNASIFSIWRSKRNRFILGFHKNKSLTSSESDLWKHSFFTEQPGILIIEEFTATHFNGSDILFNLKTNKFVGPKKENQAAIVLLDQFDGEQFLLNSNLFPDKVRNLSGREIVMSGLYYNPNTIIKYVPPNKKINNSYDLAFDGADQGAVYIDGTETKFLLTFCELYNCHLQINSDEAGDWGTIYPNTSGEASLGMLTKGKAELAVGGMYPWYEDYMALDMSMYLVRLGVSCLVPAPKRLASWFLPLQPFQFTLWLMVVIYVILEIFTLSIVAHCEKAIHTRGNHHKWPKSLKYGAIIILRLFVSQSTKKSITYKSVRFFLIFCFLNDLIVSSVYSGGLSSILTVRSYEEAPDTLARMRAQKLKWTGTSAAWTYSLLASDDENTQTLIKNFVYNTNETMFELVAKQTWIGFVLERLTFGHFAMGDYLSTQNIDYLKLMLEDIYFQYSVAFTSRLWPMLDHFDQIIYWIHSAGLDQRWEWLIVGNNSNLQKQKQVESSKRGFYGNTGPIVLDMSNFIGVLLIWILGIILATSTFLIELGQHHYYQKQAKSINSFVNSGKI